MCCLIIHQWNTKWAFARKHVSSHVKVIKDYCCYGYNPKSKILKAIIWNIFQHSKLCISARPCNVLYFFLLMIFSFTKIIFFPFYQEAELEARREQERMEEYRRQIIERERQRMLQEHASKLLGFLPKVDISYTSCVLLLCLLTVIDIYVAQQ